MRILILLLFVSLSYNLYSSEPDIDSYLNMVSQGKINEVKSQLPDLLVDYPDSPGVKLLLAIVIEDAHKALEIYKKIAMDYSDSRWADDAYWRIVQYYAIKGDTDKAKNELKYFRLKYPNSPYILPATEVVRISEGVNRHNNKVVKTNNDVIGRDNKRIQAEEKAQSKNETKPALQDFTKPSNVQKNEEKPAPKENISKKEFPVTRAPVDKKEPELIETEVPKEEKYLAINNNNSKVITQKEKESDAVRDILEKQKQIVSKSENNSNDLIASNDATGNITTPVYYGLQVGVFDTRESAEKERDRFLKKRMRTEVKQKYIDGKTMYAVVIGNYSSTESADAAKMIVKQQCNCEPIVFEK